MAEFGFIFLNVLMGGFGALITSIAKTDDKAFILPRKEANKIVLGSLWDVFIGMIITIVFYFIPYPENFQVILNVFAAKNDDQLLYSCLSSFFIGMASDYLLNMINKLRS